MSEDNECVPEGTPLPTLCDGYTTGNCWVEDGVCMLDNLNESQVTYILQKNPQARVDLLKVTTCKELHDLVDQVPLLDTVEEEDRLMTGLNQNTALPFYDIFRGNFNNM
jgi:hypothetical protein